MLNLHKFDSDVLKNATDEVRTVQCFSNASVIYLLLFAKVIEQ